ncbi:MAG TPA: CPBP family intramembrane glutamic endopeptidase [Candidatus Angelobacter sp.]|nr:CPBP family intramembrane glutamic endopeptidase [Candidatus Angelobacter sp.]
MDSFNNIPPHPDFPVAPVSLAPPPIDDGKNAIVDLIDVSILLTVVFVASFFCGIVALVVYSTMHPGRDAQALEKAISHNAWFVLPLELSIYAVLIGAMASLAVVRHKTSLGRAIRWNPPNFGRAMWAVTGGVALAFCSEMVQVIFNRWIPKSLPIGEYFQDRSSALLLAGFGVLVAPLVEELFFRGFLYPALARWTGPVAAVIVTSAGFAFIHGGQLAYSLVPLLSIFGVGVALTVTRAITKSVATSVVLHTAYNLTLFLQIYVGTHGFRNL